MILMAMVLSVILNDRLLDPLDKDKARDKEREEVAVEDVAN